MAVCGYCLLCGWKASCDEADESIRWTCGSCDSDDHFVCMRCHDALIGGKVDEDLRDEVLAVSRVLQRRNENR